jgi:hypothetical protein
MVEVLLKSLSSILKARVKVDWSLAEELKTFFQHVDVLFSNNTDAFSSF